MKKYILIAISILMFHNSKSQSNLQFQKVKLINSNLDTVPHGKLWKIESAIYSGEISIIAATTSCGNGPCADIRTASININNNSVQIRKSSAGFSTASGGLIWEIHFPIWLPEGTILSAGSNVLYLSVVEFAVVD